MKRKRKRLTLGLCLLLLAITLGACTSGSGETKRVVQTEESVMTSSDTATSVPKQESAKTTIEEQVILDRDDIMITAKEYVTDSIWGDGIKLLLENNSDKTVTVGCKALIVNHYMISDLFSVEVASGKKANQVLYLSSSELKAAGIESVGQVEVYFYVFDSASYDTIFESECVTIQTSDFATMDTTPNDLGTELYNADGIRIVGKTVDENSFWGTAILLYSENKSGKNVGISVDEMSINGFMMTPFFSTTVYDGKMSLDDITVFSNQLEDNGIDSIEQVELKFHIYDADTFSTIADSEVISFSAK